MSKKMEKLIKLIKRKDSIKAYEKLLKEAGGKPEKIAEVLRKKAWGKKSLDEILEELDK